jgi:hypothetical protein
LSYGKIRIFSILLLRRWSAYGIVDFGKGGEGHGTETTPHSLNSTLPLDHHEEGTKQMAKKKKAKKKSK